MRSLTLIFIFNWLTGCVVPNQKPSILIIAIESLGSEEFFCDEKESEFSSGLGRLCEEGVRFSHAYAPSTMSQATLASMLTGLYPKDTKVWHNGSQYLSENFLSAAEVAFEKGYRTSFFSGGPPIWRKSGLDQGFELFEDNVLVTLREPYLAVQKNFSQFLSWLDDKPRSLPFFSVVYLPDLQFPNFVTINDSGQERALGYESQLKEINESFAQFVLQMQQRKFWDSTYVFVVGLNGRSWQVRKNDLASTNLRSDTTQVLLMVKPPRKPRNDGTQWAIDANVALVDIGATLFDILDGAENIKSYDSQLEVVSLKNALQKPTVDWNRNRWILIESGWANWRSVGLSRMALRENHILFVNDILPHVYNSLSDRFETQPNYLKSGSYKSQYSELSQFFINRDLLPWEGLPDTLVQKIALFSELYQQRFSKSLQPKLIQLTKLRPWDKQVSGWLARMSLQNKDWQTLQTLGEENFSPLWTYVAKKNLGLPATEPLDSCWLLLTKEKKDPITESCDDKEFILFSQWVKAAESERRPQFEERFFRIHNQAQLDEMISSLNYINGLVWDAAVDRPAGPRLIELTLSLPEFTGFRQIVDRRAQVR